MRILFLSSNYPPYEIGGYEQLCKDVADRLNRRGHEVAILTTRIGLRGGVTITDGVYRVLTPEIDWRLWQNAAVQFFVGRRRREAENLRWFRHVVADFEPEVIFVWNAADLQRSLLHEAENLPGIRVVYYLAGYSPTEPDPFMRYWQTASKSWHKRWLKRILGILAQRIMTAEGRPVPLKLEYVLCVSGFFRDRQVQIGQLPLSSRIVYNGIDLKNFPYREPEDLFLQDSHSLKLLYAGRLTYEKGVHTAIQAVSHLMKECSRKDIKLLIIGSGPKAYVTYLHHLCLSLEIEKQVEFRNWIPRDAMPDLLQQFHILVFPTIMEEPLARIVQEAMATGLVVVGTLTGGTKEILVDGVNGLAFAPEDAKGLATQIHRLARNPTLYRRLAHAGRLTVEKKFDLKRMIDEIETYLDDVLAQ